MENKAKNKSGKGKVIAIIVVIVAVLAAVFLWFSGIVGGISEDEAKAIAYGQVPGAADDGSAIVMKEFDDLQMVYEIQILNEGMLYEFQIAARNGKILSMEFEGGDMTHTQETLGQESGIGGAASGSDSGAADQNSQNAAQTDIGIDRAKEIALAEVSGAASGDVTKAQADTDNGRLVYEVEIRYDGTEYDFDVDAATGEIISRSSESIFD